MKKLFLLFIIPLIISCEGIQYDGEKRLVFQTTVINSDGQPLPNSNVEITVKSSLISQGITDSNGKITLVFPAPSSDLPINLKIYNDSGSYLAKEFLNIRKSDFENYKFIFQNIPLLKLDETAPLELSYLQISSSSNIISNVTLSGFYQAAQEYYNFDPENYFPPQGFLVKKNQNFQLRYTVLNLQSHVETVYVVDLMIGNNPISYTINY